MKRGSLTSQHDEPHNPFALSIGDLMAALLLIFILLLSATLLQLKERAEMAEQYKDVKKEMIWRFGMPQLTRGTYLFDFLDLELNLI
jgi:hypothetical protein